MSASGEWIDFENNECECKDAVLNVSIAFSLRFQLLLIYVHFNFELGYFCYFFFINGIFAISVEKFISKKVYNLQVSAKKVGGERERVRE